MAIDVALLRKSVRQAMEGARKDAAARRARADDARQAYERFLEERAIPGFRAMAAVLRGEGLPFDVMTPAGGVRLVPERAREDGIALGLDPAFDPPRPTLTIVRSRGSRSIRTERPVREATPIDAISEDDVVLALLDELAPWFER
ncbi:MAG: hypothetical protein AB7O28_06510 [Vicinamibacterales bacterium]